MGARHDYSAITPLGSYAAKQCPVRVQLDVLQPGEPVPVEPDVQMRMDQGIAFEAEIVARLRDVAGPGWVFIDETRRGDECRAATTTAISARAPVIVGANLEADLATKRSGKPDLLVYHGNGYVPIDIKHHMTVNALHKGPPASLSDLADPTPAAAGPDELWELRRNKGDALQLAHYRRMLATLDVAATAAYGGIIGKESRVAWYRLDEPMWATPAKSDGKKRKVRTTMEVYDFEFDFRRDIAAVAHDHLTNPGVELIVEPVSCGECPTCPWREICNVTLLAGSGDASLLPNVSYKPWRALRDAGIAKRAGVADLDLATARLARAGVDTARWLADAEEVDPRTGLEEVRPLARKQITALNAAGIHTADDVIKRIDPLTASLGAFAADAIVNARAATGPEPVYRLPGGITDVPRADLEIDIDMENTNDGVYLWGVYVTDRAQSGLMGEGYRAFITWDQITPEIEFEVFGSFWDWLTDLRARAAAQGVTVKAYCWHEDAENTQMRRIAAADEALAEAVQAFIDSDDWIDMRKVFKAGWITGQSTGLKMIAPLAGFQWEVEDPGGGVAMLHHSLATGPVSHAATASREWLMDYNRSDVKATLAIREWLEASAAVPVVG